MPADSANRAYFRQALGLAIVLLGQPIAWAVRGQFFGDSESPVFPAAAMLLGVFLMLDRQWLRRAPLQCAPDAVALPVFMFLIPVVVLPLIATDDLLPYSLYALTMIVFVTALALMPTDRLDKLPEAMACVGGVSSLIPLIQLVINPISATFARLTITGNNNTLAVANVGGQAVIAAAVLAFSRGGNSGWRGLALGVVMVAGLAGVVLSNTRSVMLALVFCVPVYFVLLRPRLAIAERRSGGSQRGMFWLVLAAAAIGAPIAASVVLGPELTTQFANASIERIVGFTSLLDKDPNAVDYSSKERAEFVLYNWEHLNVFGHGMMFQERTFGVGKYPHNTFLHAFYDYGLFGGGFFLIFAAVIPFGILVRRYLAGPLDMATAMVILLFLYCLGDHLTHSGPYSWQTTAPILLVYTVASRMPVRRRGAIAPMQLGATV